MQYLQPPGIETEAVISVHIHQESLNHNFKKKMSHATNTADSASTINGDKILVTFGDCAGDASANFGHFCQILGDFGHKFGAHENVSKGSSKKNR